LQFVNRARSSAMAARIVAFPARSDNFGYLVHDDMTGTTAAIDAPEEQAIVEALESHGWTLDQILVTHHHGDHTEAIMPLKARYGARVTGPKGEAGKIEGLDETVSGGDRTLGHIAFFEPDGLHLFCGDALFSLGCGRMSEGQPGPMWEGLLRLRALPADTLVYCGHEYTLANARFALSVDPDNTRLEARQHAAQAQIEKGEGTIPSRLGDEIETNPFLRADTPEIASAMGLSGAAPAEVFRAVRAAKDNF
jgi:hydroxyacylglutathione hydrolase